MKISRILVVVFFFLICAHAGAVKRIQLNDYGVKPNTGKDMTVNMHKALAKIKAQCAAEDSVTLLLSPGRYDFHDTKAKSYPYYISNHDQDGSKRVAINMDGWSNCTLDGCGAEIVCHGVMLPIAMVNSTNCSISNLSVDFANPHISQIEIVENSSSGIKFRPSDEVKYRIENHQFVAYGEGWERKPNYGMCFEKDSHHILYRTSDTWCGVDSVVKMKNGLLYAPRWINPQLVPGTMVTLRTWQRPAPAIFLSLNKNSSISGVTVHYAEGMGLLAQLCENVTLNDFKVALRPDGGRYFTTQADATHFSGCKGKIVSVNGLYESMMDDAINVHGTYLRVKSVVAPNAVRAVYMHDQTYGMPWGFPGDSVSVVNSATMDYAKERLSIKDITNVSQKEFIITFTSPLPDSIDFESGVGLENLSWTPEVLFANNIVRNNRARGSLFSTPRKVVVEHNLYDHTSGSAILLSGDCNGWYETGACRDVTIRNNRFVNSLTSQFQFTEAIISIFPVIPDLAKQQSYFHGSPQGIVIENNDFVTFDTPLVYAVSVDGLKIENNKVTHNSDFQPYHPNQFAFNLRRVKNVKIAGNQNDTGELSVKID